MSNTPSPRLPWGALGNATALIVLALLGGWLLTLQQAPWFDPTGERDRWIATAALLIGYAGLTAWFVRARPTSDPQATPGTGPKTLVAYASQTGFAQAIAERTAQMLGEAGSAAQLRPLDRIDAASLRASERTLFVVSTTGEGDPPDHALTFVRNVMGQQQTLSGASYAVLALGDRNYRNYCGFGHQLDDWMRRAGGKALFDLVEVDNGDLGALRHWQHHLGVLVGAPELPDWAPASYQRWTLHERQHLNPGSPGGDVFEIALTPTSAMPQWQAGDIAEIGPRNAPEAVVALLAELAINFDTKVADDGGTVAIPDLLARSHLPTVEQARGMTPQALAASLRPLPHREYSIASVPVEGRLLVLLRRMLRPDGTPGLGSGWLCDYAPVGSAIDLRIRSNPGFHPPAGDRPMILIGNGTGIAGLRALLKARIDAGQRRNWLIFGERARAHDFHYGRDIEPWHADAAIERLDLAFSRDGSERRYVQDIMRERRDDLREWLQQGAAVYVCGSLQGMAPAVDAELAGIVGREKLEEMAANGRYRRDVY